MEQRDRSSSRRAAAPTDRADVRDAVLPPPLGAPSSAFDDANSGSALDPAQIVEILSHELRSPITSIHLGAKVLMAGGRRLPRPVRLEVVEAVEVEAERLYRLVEDLLAVARHDAGAGPLPVRPLVLQHWLPGVIAAEVESSPTLVVRASIPPELPPVLVDDGALEHVMRNLLANAVRHAPDGMPVEVVGSQPDDAVVRVEVLDRGPGIDGESERVFAPFYRARAADASGPGAGLGLAAVRRLLEAMDGTIEAANRTGGGARFVLTLPVARPELEEDAIELAGAPGDGDAARRRAGAALAARPA